MSEQQAQMVSAKSFMHQMLSNGLNVNSLRTNDLLRKEEWVDFDTTVVDIARTRLHMVEDLRAQGLIHNLGGLGTLVSQFETQSDMTAADLDMAGVTPGEEGSVQFNLRSIPIPIIHKDFRINIRRLEASRRLGDSVDTTQAAVASRRVSDRIEDMIFNGAGITVDGNTIPGLRTHGDRNLGGISAWDLTTNWPNIYGDIVDMLQDAYDANYYGPFMVYVSANRWSLLYGVDPLGSGDTALARIKNLPEIIDIRPSSSMPDDEVLMVQMTPDVIDLAVAQDITTVQWDSLGGMQVHFKVMAAMAPRVKSDDSNNSGIVHYS